MRQGACHRPGERGNDCRVTSFRRDDEGRACLGEAPLERLLRDANVSTPAYVYDLSAIARGVRELVAAFEGAPHVVAYAVKANSAGSVVRAIADAGGGADVVSGGELLVVLEGGVPPERVVMSGVAKTDDEIDLAIRSNIRALQVESVEEIERVAERARAAGATARVSLRINPSVEIDAHAHIATGHDEAKFGISRGDVPGAWERIDARPELEGVGVSTHVGSMLTEPGPYLESARVVCQEAKRRVASGHALDYVDFGGGFAIDYGDRPSAAPDAFAKAALGLLRAEGLSDLTLVVEPGRALVGPHGVLVAKVLQTKQSGARQWVMVDAGMNDFVRTALYQARHRIEPIERLPGGDSWRVVGPVCESADDFGDYELGTAAPTHVVVRDVGAYGFVMASEYNGRPMPTEVFVAEGKVVGVSRAGTPREWARGRLSA